MASTPTFLSRLKLSDPDLALLCVPAAYVDCTSSISDLDEADQSGKTSHLLSLVVTDRVMAVNKDKSPASWGGRVITSMAELQEKQYPFWKNIGRLQIEVADDTGRIAYLNSFAPWGWRSTQIGSKVHFLGTVKRFGDKLYVEPGAEQPHSAAIGGIWARYLGMPGRVTGEAVTGAVHAVLDKEAAYLKCERHIVAAMQLDEAGVLACVQYDLADLAKGVPVFSSLRELLVALHRPGSVGAGERALQLAQRIDAASIRTAARTQSKRQPHRDAPLIVPDQQVLALAAKQAETLTDDQRNAILGIASALRSPVPMNGLIPGDVGTGKTLTFLLPAIVAHQNGASVVIMAPTIILANQIAKQIVRRFAGEIRGVERVEAGKKIRNKDHILVGTSGLTSACSKAGIVPNVLVMDEQHKLSVQTRGALVGPATHVIEATATPIPRSLATVFFDGMQVFTLRQAPVERFITSHIVDVRSRGAVTRAIRETIAAGRRVLVVYPRVDSAEITRKAKVSKEGTQLDLRAATEDTTRTAQGVVAAAATFEQAFPGKVVALHGLLSDDEKDAAIQQITSLEKPLAVASVVVETGIDIPDIGLVVIRDADRLGLSQLHQLRGRLVRNGGAADFFMMVESIDTLEDAALERLMACKLTTNGFRLAEIDMKQRGFGSYVDDSQTGSSQGVFRLTKIAPADFLGIATATAAAGEPGAADVEDANEADALMRRVRKEVEKLRQAVAAGESPVSPAGPVVRDLPALQEKLPTPPGSFRPRPPAAAPISRRAEPTLQVRPAPAAPTGHQQLGFRLLPVRPEMRVPANLAPFVGRFPTPASRAPVAPPPLPPGAMERIKAGFDFTSAEPLHAPAAKADPAAVPGFPPRRAFPPRG
ncbi:MULTISPECIES: DEAD/DEAH box helicase [unclassified Variovorax]|uniref:DEAD/DEAH box helicase n=1 Tax=unclassified Variovorax TaxID=663243 RepID=UPI00076D2830|nr:MULTISPECIES: DEAD/DEAH box helicase [unclassified Variovorax]KWT65063.1 ATP-dependent DNA helicase [Variovorax sp. WDL1]PNG49065.1 ATP-dependent DNA helicase RecG [Variovorax sp. B2]PNG49450.1 ATP-dependent DNA helicase RecG [Variovorax sp. B4]VTV18929.1 ATP-dependent DNA helicase RecG [Variovorax sp. WDL1]